MTVTGYPSGFPLLLMWIRITSRERSSWRPHQRQPRSQTRRAGRGRARWRTRDLCRRTTRSSGSCWRKYGNNRRRSPQNQTCWGKEASKKGRNHQDCLEPENQPGKTKNETTKEKIPQGKPSKTTKQTQWPAWGTPDWPQPEHAHQVKTRCPHTKTDWIRDTGTKSWFTQA